MLNNKNILITGGTGSFGNLFVETIIKKFKPRICLAGWYFRNNQRIADILEPVIKEYDYDIFVGHRGNFMALPK